MKDAKDSDFILEEDVMKKFNITQEDLDKIGDIEIG